MWAEIIEAAAHGDKRAARILNWTSWIFFVLLVLVSIGVLFVGLELGIILMNS